MSDVIVNAIESRSFGLLSGRFLLGVYFFEGLLVLNFLEALLLASAELRRLDCLNARLWSCFHDYI